MSADNIIPINRGLVTAMRRLLDALKDMPWQGPKTFNAILIDRKDFMKMMSLPNPPPPVVDIAVRERLDIIISSQALDAASINRVRFDFYRRIGDTLEYREN